MKNKKVTYTNRKGKVYYLYAAVTKTGKQRYTFAAKSKGEPIDAIPEGYEIRENVNGRVSLAKIAPQLILPDEQNYVENAISDHPQKIHYRVDVKKNEIVVYESNLSEADGLANMLAEISRQSKDKVMITMMEHATFMPMLKFTLVDKNKRLFQAKRLDPHYSDERWIEMSAMETIQQLTDEIIPRLDEDEFFDFFKVFTCKSLPDG